MSFVILLLTALAGTISGTLTGVLNPRGRTQYLNLFIAGIIGFAAVGFVSATPETFGMEHLRDLLGILYYFAAFGACFGFFGTATGYMFK